MTSIAKIAYEAYSRSTGRRSLITGDKLPQWENLKEPIQAAWVIAADAVAAHIRCLPAETLCICIEGSPLNVECPLHAEGRRTPETPLSASELRAILAGYWHTY